MQGKKYRLLVLLLFNLDVKIIAFLNQTPRYTNWLILQLQKNLQESNDCGALVPRTFCSGPGERAPIMESLPTVGVHRMRIENSLIQR